MCTMKVHQQYFIWVLTMTIILILFDDCCCERNWPTSHNFFNVTVTHFIFPDNDTVIPVKLSKIERLLVYIKHHFKKEKSSTISDAKILKDIKSISTDEISSSNNNLLVECNSVNSNKRKILLSPNRNKRHIGDWFNKIHNDVSTKFLLTVKNVESKIKKIVQVIIDKIDTSIDLYTKDLKGLVNNIGDSIGKSLNGLKSHIRTIFPGTRWCGDGDIAKSYDDVGLFERTDACCREHDKCPFNIQINDHFGPLKNIGLFTKSACFCDRKFYDCLKNVRSLVAMKIGHTYFTLLAPQCIGYYYLDQLCKQEKGATNNKSVESNSNTTRGMTLKWYSSPNF